MKAPQPQKPRWCRIEKKPRPVSRKEAMSETVNVEETQEKSRFSFETVLHYTLLLVKVALWIISIWILSYLHMGASCFLLSLAVWMYSVPMEYVLKWSKRRLVRKKGM